MSDRNPNEPEGQDFVRFDHEVTLPEPGPPPSEPEVPGGSALTDNITGADEPEPDPSDPSIAADSPELQVVRNLTAALTKAVKATQLYPLENPMCVKFADELMARINQAFSTFDVIRLSVGKTKLFFAGETVLEQSAGDESVPGRLFWAGVREISFHVGLTSQEALDFLAVFRDSSQVLAQGEGDIVTLLWEGHFEHITYIAVNDILDLENEADPIPQEFGMDFMNFVDLDMHDLENEELNEQRASEMAEEIRAKMNQEDVALFGIRAEEMDALVAETKEDESSRMLQDMVHIIGETLFLETDEVSFVELVEVLAGALLALVGEGRLAAAAEVIGMLVELLEEGQHFSAVQLTVLEAGLASAYDRSPRESLVRHLDSGKRSTLEALDAFVRALPKDSVEALCDVLGNLQTRPAQRRMERALSLKAQDDIRPFLPFLEDPRYELVRSVARILGGAKNDRALHPLKGLLRHPDFHVRREALHALSTLGTGRAMDLLAESLFDPDPRIRMAGARYLGMTGRQAIPILITVIEADDFDKRPLPEKRSFYEALGFAGGEDMIPIMERALNRRSWFFGRTQIAEIRACACEALGWIGGPQARELLSEAVKDRSILVRTAAQSGLRRIASGKKEPLAKEAA